MIIFEKLFRLGGEINWDSIVARTLNFWVGQALEYVMISNVKPTFFQDRLLSFSY